MDRNSRRDNAKFKAILADPAAAGQRRGDRPRPGSEALRRGYLPQEIEGARCELALAETRVRRIEVERDLCIVRAPPAGTILEHYRPPPAGTTLKVSRPRAASVVIDEPTPILRMANTARLGIRREVAEASVPRL